MTKTVPPKRDVESPENGAETPETVRRCIVSGKTFPKEELIRFCVSPSGEVVPDLACKLPGRGIWVRADADVLRTAMIKGLFAKAAGSKVTYPQDLAERVETLFIRRCLDLLGVAKKAGLVVSGFEKVAAALQKGTIVCLLEAEDGAADGREKLLRMAKGVPVLYFLTGDDTAHALGRERGVHTGLKSGGATDKFLAEAKRYRAFVKKEPNV